MSATFGKSKKRRYAAAIEAFHRLRHLSQSGRRILSDLELMASDVPSTKQNHFSRSPAEEGNDRDSSVEMEGDANTTLTNCLDMVGVEDLRDEEWSALLAVLAVHPTLQSIDATLLTAIHHNIVLRGHFIRAVTENENIVEVITDCTKTKALLQPVLRAHVEVQKSLLHRSLEDDKKSQRQLQQDGFVRQQIAEIEREEALRQQIEYQWICIIEPAFEQFKATIVGLFQQANTHAQAETFLRNIDAVIEDSCVTFPTRNFNAFMGQIISILQHLECAVRSELVTDEAAVRNTIRRRYFKGHERASNRLVGRLQCENNDRLGLLARCVLEIERTLWPQEQSQRRILYTYHEKSLNLLYDFETTVATRKAELRGKVESRLEELKERQQNKSERLSKETYKLNASISIESDKLNRIETSFRNRILQEEERAFDAHCDILVQCRIMTEARAQVNAAASAVSLLLRWRGDILCGDHLAVSVPPPPRRTSETNDAAARSAFLSAGDKSGSYPMMMTPRPGQTSSSLGEGSVRAAVTAHHQQIVNTVLSALPPLIDACPSDVFDNATPLVVCFSAMGERVPLGNFRQLSVTPSVLNAPASEIATSGWKELFTQALTAHAAAVFEYNATVTRAMMVIDSLQKIATNPHKTSGIPATLPSPRFGGGPHTFGGVAAAVRFTTAAPTPSATQPTTAAAALEASFCGSLDTLSYVSYDDACITAVTAALRRVYALIPAISEAAIANTAAQAMTLRALVRSVKVAVTLLPSVNADRGMDDTVAREGDDKCANFSFCWDGGNEKSEQRFDEEEACCRSVLLHVEDTPNVPLKHLSSLVGRRLCIQNTNTTPNATPTHGRNIRLSLAISLQLLYFDANGTLSTTPAHEDLFEQQLAENFFSWMRLGGASLTGVARQQRARANISGGGGTSPQGNAHLKPVGSGDAANQNNASCCTQFHTDFALISHAENLFGKKSTALGDTSIFFYQSLFQRPFAEYKMTLCKSISEIHLLTGKLTRCGGAPESTDPSSPHSDTGSGLSELLVIAVKLESTSGGTEAIYFGERWEHDTLKGRVERRSPKPPPSTSLGPKSIVGKSPAASPLLVGVGGHLSIDSSSGRMDLHDEDASAIYVRKLSKYTPMIPSMSTAHPDTWPAHRITEFELILSIKAVHLVEELLQDLHVVSQSPHDDSTRQEAVLSIKLTETTFVGSGLTLLTDVSAAREPPSLSNTTPCAASVPPATTPRRMSTSAGMMSLSRGDTSSSVGCAETLTFGSGTRPPAKDDGKALGASTRQRRKSSAFSIASPVCDSLGSPAPAPTRQASVASEGTNSSDITGPLMIRSATAAPSTILDLFKVPKLSLYPLAAIFGVHACAMSGSAAGIAYAGTPVVLAAHVTLDPNTAFLCESLHSRASYPRKADLPPIPPTEAEGPHALKVPGGPDASVMCCVTNTFSDGWVRRHEHISQGVLPPSILCASVTLKRYATEPRPRAPSNAGNTSSKAGSSKTPTKGAASMSGLGRRYRAAEVVLVANSLESGLKGLASFLRSYLFIAHDPTAKVRQYRAGMHIGVSPLPSRTAAEDFLRLLNDVCPDAQAAAEAATQASQSDPHSSSSKEASPSSAPRGGSLPRDEVENASFTEKSIDLSSSASASVSPVRVSSVVLLNALYTALPPPPQKPLLRGQSCVSDVVNDKIYRFGQSLTPVVGGVVCLQAPLIYYPGGDCILRITGDQDTRIPALAVDGPAFENYSIEMAFDTSRFKETKFEISTNTIEGADDPFHPGDAAGLVSLVSPLSEQRVTDGVCTVADEHGNVRIISPQGTHPPSAVIAHVPLPLCASPVEENPPFTPKNDTPAASSFCGGARLIITFCALREVCALRKIKPAAVVNAVLANHVRCGRVKTEAALTMEASMGFGLLSATATPVTTAAITAINERSVEHCLLTARIVPAAHDAEILANVPVYVGIKIMSQPAPV